MDKLSVEQILSRIETLSVVELVELTKKLKEKFGLSDLTLSSAVGPTSSPSTETKSADSEEKTHLNVILSSAGDQRIAVIKAVREINPNLGLKEAKDLVEGTPKTLLEGAKKETAEEIKKKLEGLGAQVELQ